jgi:hypothetical protein
MPAPAILFPWRAWLAHPLLRSWTTWLFVVLVAVPPLAFTLLPTRGTDVAMPVTVFAFYFAAAWFLVLWMVVRPQKIRGQLLAQLVGRYSWEMLSSAAASGTEYVGTPAALFRSALSSACTRNDSRHCAGLVI